jgi:hypothetical protein
MRLVRSRVVRLGVVVLGLMFASLGLAVTPAGAGSTSWATQKTLPALLEIVNGVSCPTTTDCWAVALTSTAGVAILRS